MTHSTPMSTPMRPPVLDFFARFQAKPDPAALYRFRIDLLDLELTRAQHNLLRDPPLVRASAAHCHALEQAERALIIARRLEFPGHDRTRPDLSRFWLALLGHRLSVERGLDMGDRAALAHVAADRFDLSPGDTATWSEGVLFRQYTRTVLRQEWDYVGLQFRMVCGPVLFRSRRMRAAGEG